MAELIAVMGSTNTHVLGDLSADNNSGKVFIGGIKVVYVGSHAAPDLLCFTVGPPHCDPVATTGSTKVFGEGIAIHRHNDGRICGASTVVNEQSKVFAG